MSTPPDAPAEDEIGAYRPGGRVAIAGAAAGPLAGLSFAIKDIFDVAGRVTRCGNPDWARTHAPAARHAGAVQRLLDAGASATGITVTEELAFGLTGENAHDGTPQNVNAPGRVPGGSSAGSAAAVAAGLVDFALGSDTGGSVRVPASFCGIYGLRPSHGRVDIAGVMPLAQSLDTLGWFARAPAVLRRVGGVLLDSNGAAGKPGRVYLAEDAFARADGGVRDALAPVIARAGRLLGAPEPVTVGALAGLEGLDTWGAVFRAILGRECWANHGAWVERVEPRFGDAVAERLRQTSMVSEAEAEAAALARERISRHVAALLGEDAVLLVPAAPCVAPLRGLPDHASATLRHQTLGITSIAGLARLPQISLPLAMAAPDDLAAGPAGDPAENRLCPVALGVIAPRGGDEMLLDLAVALAEAPA